MKTLSEVRAEKAAHRQRQAEREARDLEARKEFVAKLEAANIPLYKNVERGDRTNRETDRAEMRKIFVEGATRVHGGYSPSDIACDHCGTELVESLGGFSCELKYYNCLGCGFQMSPYRDDVEYTERPR